MLHSFHSCAILAHTNYPPSQQQQQQAVPGRCSSQERPAAGVCAHEACGSNHRDMHAAGPEAAAQGDLVRTTQAFRAAVEGVVGCGFSTNLRGLIDRSCTNKQPVCHSAPQAPQLSSCVQQSVPMQKQPQCTGTHGCRDASQQLTVE